MNPVNRCCLSILLLICLALTGCNADCLGDPNCEVEDVAARIEYYKEAAKVYYDGGRYDAAVNMWNKVLVESPDDQWAKFGLAKSLHMMGTPQSLRRAEVILNDIMCLNWVHPTRGDVKFEVQSTLANVYSSLADYFDRDVRSLELRLEHDPSADTRALTKQVQCQKRTRDDLLRKSMPLWQAVLCKSPDNPYALAGLSKAHLITGDENTGIRYAERYVALSRKSQVQWKEQLCKWQGTVKGDMTVEQRDFYLNKIHGAREKEVGMRLLLGSVYMRRDQFSRAVQEFDEVIAMDPAIPAPYVERAQAYAALGLYSKGIKDLERYLKMTDPKKQRHARVNAAELLDKYRRIAGQRPGYRPARAEPAATARAQPAPQRAPAPPIPSSQPSASAYGSPDG